MALAYGLPLLSIEVRKPALSRVQLTTRDPG
jgi:hypothetical protein